MTTIPIKHAHSDTIIGSISLSPMLVNHILMFGMEVSLEYTIDKANTNFVKPLAINLCVKGTGKNTEIHNE